MKNLGGALERVVSIARGSRQEYLFVTGCPRSGTTALWQLLVSHPQIVLGVERYGTRVFEPEFLDPSLFEYERFFRIQSGDTFYSDLSFAPEYEAMRGRFRDARYRGDKIPYLYRYLPRLEQAFGNRMRVIVITRDLPSVAWSYQRRHDDPFDPYWPGVDALDAVRDWKEALEATSTHVTDRRYLVVSYQRLLEEGLGLSRILDFLDLEPAPEMLASYELQVTTAREVHRRRPKSAFPDNVTEAIEATLESARYRALATRVLEFTG